jgi:capsular exopolysaccharide synthesis family protein
MITRSAGGSGNRPPWGDLVTDLETSTLQHYLGVLWRRRWFVVVPLVLLPVVVYASSARKPKVYRASASVLLNHQDQVASGVIGVQSPVDDPNRYAVTQTQVAWTPRVARQVLDAAGFPRRTTKNLLDHTGIYPIADTIVFAVRDHDPAVAARLASTYARVYVAYRRQLDTSELAETLTELQQRIAGLGPNGGASKQLYASLESKAEEIRVLEALRRSNVSLLTTPSLDDVELIAPLPAKNTSLALPAGLIIGIVLAFLAEALDTRVRSAEELEAGMGLPLLGRVPPQTNGGTPALALLGAEGTGESEAFLTLRTRLALANLDLQGRVLLVASVCDGEGGAPVAGNLALALARAGSRVALVELDLRNPELGRLFGVDEARPGFTSVALRESTLDEALTPVALDPDGPAAQAGRLELLTSGPLPPRPADFAGSAVAAQVLKELRERSDLILVHAPPLLSVGDAAALGPGVDALVLVSRLGVVRRSMVRDLRRALSSWPAATLGLVVVEPRGSGRRRRGPGARLRQARSGAPRTAQAAESWR